MRYLIAALAIVALVGGLAAVKASQISQLIAAGKKFEKMGPPPEAVSTAVAREQQWGGTISAVGTITSAKGVTISNEVAGTVSAIRFESGSVVKRGQVLLELDSRVERAQLASIVARLELAKVNASRTRALADNAAISKSQVDADESALKTSTADVEALRAQIDRKIVRAPFDGRLGIRQINMGQYLSPGTTITQLEAIDLVFVDFTLPQQDLDAIKVGMPVKVAIEGAGLSADGKIDAISPAIDATTRSMKVRATVPNKDEKLRPGMFASVAVVLPERGKLITVPVTCIVHASYGDSVFVAEDKKDDAGSPVMGPDGKPAKVARQQFVRVGESRGDFVAVLDGVKVGQELVSAGAFKLRNNAGVMINNELKVEPELNPHPMNR